MSTTAPDSVDFPPVRLIPLQRDAIRLEKNRGVLLQQAMKGLERLQGLESPGPLQQVLIEVCPAGPLRRLEGQQLSPGLWRSPKQTDQVAQAHQRAAWHGEVASGSAGGGEQLAAEPFVEVEERRTCCWVGLTQPIPILGFDAEFHRFAQMVRQRFRFRNDQLMRRFEAAAAVNVDQFGGREQPELRAGRSRAAAPTGKP